MTPKQKRFVQEYSLSHCAADAARRAGYSAKTARQMASENLTKPAILEALAVLEDATAQELDLTREKVLQELQEAIQLARAKGDPAAMISGWREIAKMCGFYRPETVRMEVSGSPSKEFRLVDQHTSSDAANNLVEAIRTGIED